ncbi:MAG TPA: DUF3311 domain-containing protein [Pilimelia sp.]|nr:DUF3311 domain-containing protein [Pilimelia sp.]
MAKPTTATRVVAYTALALPFAAILWVPLYARTEPRLAGLPFFYWYQFAWILLTLVLLAISYRLLRRVDDGPDQDPPARTPPPWRRP